MQDLRTSLVHLTYEFYKDTYDIEFGQWERQCIAAANDGNHKTTIGVPVSLTMPMRAWLEEKGLSAQVTEEDSILLYEISWWRKKNAF